MDVLELSRIQFGMTAAFHFLFVPLTLGLVVQVAYMQWRYLKTGDETYLKMTKFWGRLFLINFALGVVTGLAMAFQFGMNWAAFAVFAGDTVGMPIAIESMTAFFIESTFIGMWVFGWQKISNKLHTASIIIFACATHISATWILFVNGWMQNPVGYVLQNNRAEMVDLAAFVSNPTAWIKIFHVLGAAYILGGFFVMGISAYHLLRDPANEVFMRSMRVAAPLALAAAILVPITGDFHGIDIGEHQPAKLAAIEAIWETEKGADYALIVLPDAANEQNFIEAIKIPGLLSFLVHHDVNAEVTGLNDIPKEERPPVLMPFISFRSMVALGLFFLIMSAYILVQVRKDKIAEKKRLLRVLPFLIPLPYLSI